MKLGKKKRGSLYLLTTSPESTLALGKQALGASAGALHEVLALGLHLLNISVSAARAACGCWGCGARGARFALATDL